MANFVVATDSGCDLPVTFTREKGIEIIPLYYVLDGEEYEDKMDGEGYAAFYDKMRGGAVPKTGQINQVRFEEFFLALREKYGGLPVVYISLGGELSGTICNARAAAEKLNGDKGVIYAIDSTQCSAGYGLLAVTAARLRDEGMSAKEAAEYIERNKSRLNALCSTDDLSYLRRSGRCSLAAAVIGGIFKICPVLTLDKKGALGVRKRVRGYQNAVKEMFALVRSTVENAAEQTLFISHSDAKERAEEFGEALKKEVGFKDVFYAEIGTVIGSHCGPGVVAAFYYGKERV